MPTFSTIAFDRLLEPGPRHQKPPHPIRGRQVSPALYATPKATPIPQDSPSSFSPVSPYIVNHKRRGASLSESKITENNNSNNNNDNDDINEGCGAELSEIVERVEERIEREEKEREEMEEELEVKNDNLERESETDDFFEFNDSMSNVSESFKPGTPNGEFYDAFEEISSESGATFNSSSNRGNSIEEEMREMRLSLLMEIEKRKQTEESLAILQNQWLRLSQHLASLGLNLPVPQIQNSNLNFEFDPVEELCNQIRVSRAVSEAIEKGISRAELAEEIERIVQVKNFEIGRLTDRVQYYEAANREMTHRNQEAIEMARQERNRKQRRQKWFYASLGFAVTLGSAAIVWSYLPASQSVQINQKNSSDN